MTSLSTFVDILHHVCKSSVGQNSKVVVTDAESDTFPSPWYDANMNELLEYKIPETVASADHHCRLCENYILVYNKTPVGQLRVPSSLKILPASDDASVAIPILSKFRHCSTMEIADYVISGLTCFGQITHLQIINGQQINFVIVSFRDELAAEECKRLVRYAQTVQHTRVCPEADKTIVFDFRCQTKMGYLQPTRTLYVFNIPVNRLAEISGPLPVSMHLYPFAANGVTMTMSSPSAAKKKLKKLSKFVYKNKIRHVRASYVDCIIDY